MSGQLSQSFAAAARHVQKEISGKLSEAQLLSLFGLYKQAMQGNCPFPRPDPSVDPAIVAKWKVWADCHGLSKQQAAVQYIATVVSYDPAWEPPGGLPPTSPGGSIDGSGTAGTPASPASPSRSGAASSPATVAPSVASPPSAGSSASSSSLMKKGTHAKAMADLTGGLDDDDDEDDNATTSSQASRNSTVSSASSAQATQPAPSQQSPKSSTSNIGSSGSPLPAKSAPATVAPAAEAPGQSTRLSTSSKASTSAAPSASGGNGSSGAAALGSSGGAAAKASAASEQSSSRESTSSSAAGVVASPKTEELTSQGAPPLSPGAARTTGPTGASLARNTSTPSRSSSDGMEGVLFKQRAHFSGWRPRFFKLEGQVLTYFLDRQDPTPRGTLFVESCTIEVPPDDSAKKAKVAGVKAPPGQGKGAEYYRFCISHESASKEKYHLATDSTAGRDAWVAALRAASQLAAPCISTHDSRQRNGSGSGSFAATSHASSPDRPSPSSSFNSTTSSAPALASSAQPITGAGLAVTSALGANNGASNVPMAQWAAVERCLRRFMQLADENPDQGGGWTPFGEKLGVRGFKQSKGGPHALVRGDSLVLVQQPLATVFKLLWDPGAKANYDAQLEKGARVKVFNAQTCVDHLTLKGVWPTSPRDFLSTVHWRLVGPNALALVAVACPASALSPEVRRAYPLCESAAAEAAGCVRGELIMAGWRLKEVPSSTPGQPPSTEVTYLVQSDIKGNVPTSVVNTVAQQQAFMVAALRKELEANPTAYGPQPPGSPPVTTSTSALSTLASAVNETTWACSADAPSAASQNAEKYEPSASSTSTATAARSGNGSGGGCASAGASSPASASVSAPATAAAVGGGAIAQPSKSGPVGGMAARGGLTWQHLCLLLLPSAAWVTFATPGARAMAFLVALAWSFRTLIQLQLGQPVARRMVEGIWGPPAAAAAVFRFPVELKRLLRYIETKRQVAKEEINVTHVTMKACAVALKELPHLNGHLALGQFHPWPSADVAYLAPSSGGGNSSGGGGSGSSASGSDASGRGSISGNSSGSGSGASSSAVDGGGAVGAMLLSGCDRLSVGTIAARLRAAAETNVTRSEPYAANRQKLLQTLSLPFNLLGNLGGGGGGLLSGMAGSGQSFVVSLAESVLGWLSSVGVDLPALGVKRWPCGTCCVLTPPSDSGVEMEVDVIPGTGNLSSGGGGMSTSSGGSVGQLAAVVFTVGGIRVQSGYMKDKQMAARPVLHMSAAVDLRAATVFEAKALVERVQQLLRDPSLLDKYDKA